MSDEKLYFVTEVGVFEEIDIDDPTAVEIEENKKNLKDK